MGALGLHASAQTPRSSAAFGGGCPARHDLDVRLLIRQRAPDADLGVRGTVRVLGCDLDPKARVVRLDNHSDTSGMEYFRPRTPANSS